MASSSLKGKGKVPEHASSSEDESIQMETTKKRRMDFKVCVRQILPVKYVNLKAFPGSSFYFPTLLKYQRIDNFVSDSGNCYNDLVKAFLHKFSVYLNADDEHVLETSVRDCLLVENLVDIAAKLNIPSSGYFLRKGVNHVEGPWEIMIRWNIIIRFAGSQRRPLLQIRGMLACYVMRRI